MRPAPAERSLAALSERRRVQRPVPARKLASGLWRTATVSGTGPPNIHPAISSPELAPRVHPKVASVMWNTRLVLCLNVVVVLCSARTASADEQVPRTGPFSKRSYPTELIYRPLTLPRQMIETSLSGGYWWMDEEPNTSVAWASLRYGITDCWRASVSTGFGATPEIKWVELVVLSTRHLAVDTSWLDFAPGLRAPVDLSDDEDAHMFPGVTVDATTRLYITDSMALHLGEGLVPIGIDNKSLSIDMNYSLIAQKPGSRFGMRMSVQALHVRVYGDVRESSLSPDALLIGAFFSPNNRWDIRLTWTTRFGADAISAGLTARM